MTDQMEINRRNWNSRVAIHVRDATGSYDLKGFKRGADKLHAIEAGEIGDVSGLDLVHLQCHFGLDTLSLARRGARVTGIDFSAPAIEEARKLAVELGIPATFTLGNVYDTARLAPGPFDFVYTTWGTICWLPDLRPWAEQIARVLKPGGRFYFSDFHPTANMYEEVDGRIEPRFGWRTTPDKPLAFETGTTYTGDATPLASPETREWIHPVSEIVGSLLDVGLTLVFLHEHERAPSRQFPSVIPDGKDLFRLPPGVVPFPLALSLMAQKPE
ncbi:MAG: class I SAM-dependent methyltransferase [Alphaproteobacteria bacterium]